MFLINKSSGVSFYEFPLPTEPSAYIAYLIVENGNGYPDQHFCEQVNRELSDTHVKQIIILLKGYLSPIDKKIFLNDMDTLRIFGISWIFNLPILVSLKTLSKNETIEIPFIPEFAHDISRTQKLAAGDFYNILPITAEFVPTLNCPFRCQQCSYKMQKIACGNWKKNNSAIETWNMPPSSVRPLIQRLADAQVQNLVVTGGGEPLMNSEASINALSIAKEYGINTGLYTNGVFLDKRLVSQILDQVPKFVRVSINAGSDEIHTRYHRPIGKKSLFQNVKNGVKELAIQKITKSVTTEIGLSYIVNPVNFRDCKAFAEWVSGMVNSVSQITGIKEPIIDFVRFTPTINYFGKAQHSREFFREAVDLISETALPILREANIETKLFLHRFDHIDDQSKSYTECLGCSWFAEISPDGSMYMCCELLFIPEFLLGNMHAKSIQSIWSGDLRNKVIYKVNSTDLKSCPIFCKPDQINKLFNRIKELCRHPDEKSLVWQWLLDLNQMHQWKPDFPFKKEKTVAF